MPLADSMNWSRGFRRPSRGRAALQEKKDMQAALLELVEPESLPPEYGGTAGHALYESEFERRLAEHVRRMNGGGGGGIGAGGA